jgi:hypothetical protein
MPRVAWSEFAQQSKFHVLVAEVEETFFGGKLDSDPYDSRRLREAANLMNRVLSELDVPGSYATTPSRGAVGVNGSILCAFERGADRDRVADLIDARLCARTDGWSSRRAFPLTPEIHDRLIGIGGETDNRWGGRRRLKREAEARAERSLRWGER